MANDIIVVPRSKLILIAPNRPRGDEPLFPRPHGAAGAVLAKIIHEAVGWSREEYLMRTERIALVNHGGMNEADARAHAKELMSYIDNRRAVCIGAIVRAIFDAPEDPFEWHGNIAFMPHPSRINPFYSRAANWSAAVAFFQQELGQ